MSESVKKHLPVIAIVTVIALASAAYALLLVHDNVASMSVDAFSAYIIVIPCVAMLVGSFAITVTAQTIGRQLYIVVLAICFVLGLVSLVVTSLWMSDPSIASALLANSPEGTTITPVTESLLTVVRDIAAYVVVPTVGCIAGAWVGSRVHPVEREGGRNGGRGRRK